MKETRTFEAKLFKYETLGWLVDELVSDWKSAWNVFCPKRLRGQKVRVTITVESLEQDKP